MPTLDGFHHGALLYDGPAQFAAGTVPTIRSAVQRGEPVMVMVDRAKIDVLDAALGGDIRGVRVADVRAVGHNPACIIPACQAFVDEHAHAGRPIHAIAEPVWVERSAAELVECRHHEALLDVAFAGTPSFRLLCAYDMNALAPAVVAGTRETHRFVCHNGDVEAADSSQHVDPRSLFAEALPDPPQRIGRLVFDKSSMATVRRFVSRYATAANLHERAKRDLTLAANELAANSVRHGGGTGTLRIWLDGHHVVCEVVDQGHISDLLVGRRRPGRRAMGGRGLWIANRLCDLVQIRSAPTGTVVRLHMRCA